MSVILDGSHETIDRDIVYIVGAFDDLVANRGSLQALLSEAVTLTGCAAGLIDPSRRVRMRLSPNGTRNDGDPHGIVLAFGEGGRCKVWLEKPATSQRPMDDVVLKRLAAASQVVLDRTRRATSWDSASVETLVDREAAPADRHQAARSLGLCGGPLSVIVSPFDPAVKEQASSARLGSVTLTVCDLRHRPRILPPRAGIATAAALEDLPASFDEAKLALRLTACGTPSDPGPTHLEVNTVGGLLVLAATVQSEIARREIKRIETFAMAHRWGLETLTALTECDSVRAAANMLYIHHSTMQGRVAMAEKLLGYSLRTADGQTRAKIGLALRRFRNNENLAD